MFYIEAQKTLSSNTEIQDGQVVVVNSPASPAAATAKKLGLSLNSTSPDRNSPQNSKKGANNRASSVSPQKANANATKNLPNSNSPKGKEKEKVSLSPSSGATLKATTAQDCTGDDGMTAPTVTEHASASKKKTRRGPRKSKKKNANANTNGEAEGGTESDGGELDVDFM